MLAAIAVLPFMFGAANAICGGFNFAIGNAIPLGSGFTHCKYVATQVDLYALMAVIKKHTLQGMFTTMIVASLTGSQPTRTLVPKASSGARLRLFCSTSIQTHSLD